MNGELIKPEPTPVRGTGILEVLGTFLRLGCLSFGGPVAHIGYFHAEFVGRRKWCDESTFAEIVALSQSMPGPASSQAGFALGILRAGWMGGVAAWVGFTMPSALLMLAFAFGHRFLTGSVGLGVVRGLQLVAAAVVAQAILAMRKALAPDAARVILALAAAVIVYFDVSTLAGIILGALGGFVLPRPQKQSMAPALPFRISRTAGLFAAMLFAALLIGLQAAASLSARKTGSSIQPIEVANAFYRTGALVFGGGHVVLPLLEKSVVARGWVDQQSFLSGYGAAQAVPGPLFTFAAYLGALIRPTLHPVAISALALGAIFLPGLLAVVAVLPFWSSLRERWYVQASLRGVNASVVGILVAALVGPVWHGAMHSFVDVVLAVAAFGALVRWKAPPWAVVVGMLGISIVRPFL